MGYTVNINNGDLPSIDYDCPMTVQLQNFQHTWQTACQLLSLPKQNQG